MTEEIKNRLLNIGEAIGQIAFDYIVELEKENAELKDDNKVMADNYFKMEQKFYDNLTKAKEIIKEYIRINLLPPTERNFDDEVKLFKQAVDFIKESE
ncbi:MAG: hypothetical protein K6B75_06045 [Lachnospiraceae bacterium]|nr:hypothetical protein [Lachnospiraceae bacterium]